MAKLRIQIFDPPMCCPTGMCGPTIDSTLIKIHEALSRIQKEYNGKVEVTRHLFGKDLPAFLSNSLVMKLIRQKGPEVLPITALGSRVIKSGSYPTFEELKELIENHL